MKKIISILSIFIGLLILVSCEEDQTGPVLKEENLKTPSSLKSLSGTSFTLSQDNEDGVMTTFTWNEADYGVEVPVTYTLQMVKSGNDFSSPSEIASTTNDSVDINVGAINSKLYLGLGLSTGVSHDVDIRLRAVVNENVDTLYSEPLTISVQPYEVEYPKLYVPGSYQGWDAANEETAIYSVEDNGIYTGYLYFPDETTELKLLKVPAWEEDNTIGDPDASGTSGTLQIGSWGGNNIKVTGGPGYFKFDADLNNKTYEYLKTTWGIIGSATAGGWDSDQDMTFNETDKIWTATLDLTAGEIKFRANDAWDLNYGDDDANGTLEKGGANIAISEAGNYTITLNLSKPPYRYTLTKN
jgi:hypothetical protein